MIQEILTYICVTAAFAHLVNGTYRLVFVKNSKTKCESCNGTCNTSKSFIVKKE